MCTQLTANHFYNKMKKINLEHTFLIDSKTKEEINGHKLLHMTLNLAEGLSRLGVRKGDVIAIVSENNPKFLVTVISAFYIGAKVTLLNPTYTSREMTHLLIISQPVLIFCTSLTFDEVLKLRTELFFPTNVIVYDESDDLLSMENGGDTFTPSNIDPEDVALILTSSGTSGLPKCVLITYANITSSLAIYQEVLYFDSKDTVLGNLPFFHVYGLNIALSAILNGCRIIILEKFIPDRFLQAIQDHKVNKLYIVPPMIHFLLESPLIEDYDLSSLIEVGCGAASVSKQLEEAFSRKFKTLLRQGYGLTETTGMVVVVPKNVTRYGSVGKTVRGHCFKICDTETGKVLLVNQTGELRIKGSSVMKGYLGNEEASREVFDDDGYLKTGDLAYFDKENFIYIVGRLKDLIKYKGFQVSPSELENVLFQHPAVKDCAVIGLPDEKAGELPMAFVVKSSDKNVTAEELVRFVGDRVSVQKRLYGGVRFVEVIPKSAAGKVLKRKLREPISLGIGRHPYLYCHVPGYKVRINYESEEKGPIELTFK